MLTLMTVGRFASLAFAKASFNSDKLLTSKPKAPKASAEAPKLAPIKSIPECGYLASSCSASINPRLLLVKTTLIIGKLYLT